MEIQADGTDLLGVPTKGEETNGGTITRTFEGWDMKTIGISREEWEMDLLPLAMGGIDNRPLPIMIGIGIK